MQSDRLPNYEIILYVSNKEHVKIKYKFIKEQINILAQGLREVTLLIDSPDTESATKAGRRNLVLFFCNLYTHSWNILGGIIFFHFF